MIHNSKSKKLIKMTKQLDRNYDAYRKIMRRYETIRTNDAFYEKYNIEYMRKAELAWNLKIATRILRMRESLLARIGMAIMGEQKRTVTWISHFEVNEMEVHAEIIKPTSMQA